MDYCPLMKAPLEIRLQIYEQLLPENPISALNEYDEKLLGVGAKNRESGIFNFNSPPAPEDQTAGNVSSKKWNFTTPLLVCKQMKAELVPVLYGQPTFCIHVCFVSDSCQGVLAWAAICNEEPKFQSFRSRRGILNEDREENEYSEEVINKRTGKLTNSGFSGYGRAWYPRLAKQYFTQIRNFQISLTFNNCQGWDTGIFPAVEPPHDNKLYEITDHLHAIVTQLKKCHRIKTLTIDICFKTISNMNPKLFVAIQIFLEPFRRLNNIDQFQVRSIYGDSFPRFINLLEPTFQFDWVELQRTESTIYGDRPPLGTFLNQLCKDIQRNTNAHPLELPVFDLYWKIEKAVSHMMALGSWVKSVDDKVLERMRKAREKKDLPVLKRAWAGFMADWNRWRTFQLRFIGKMDEDLKSVSDEVRNSD